jgi:hypothetical protein
MRAIDSQSIRKATLEDEAHLAVVVYRNGRTATVRYPASDTTLAQRMVRDGVDVRISTATSGPFLPPLPIVMALLMTMSASNGPSSPPHRQEPPRSPSS